MKCERCQAETKDYALHDYCAKCSKNLCDACMAKGCCGAKPAESGMALDAADDDEAQTMAEDALFATEEPRRESTDP